MNGSGNQSGVTGDLFVISAGGTSPKPHVYCMNISALLSRLVFSHMRQCQTFFSWQARSRCVQNRAWLVLVLCCMFGQLSFFQCMSMFAIPELMFDEVVLFHSHTYDPWLHWSFL